MVREGDAEWTAADLHALADLVASLVPSDLPSEQLDQLEALGRVMSAAAAARAVVTASFADTADSDDPPVCKRRTPPRAMSVGAEVALATLSSPHSGEQRVLLSRRLRDDLPQTLAALARGELTEDRALAVAGRSATSLPSSAAGSTTTSRRASLGSATYACAQLSADPA